MAPSPGLPGIPQPGPPMAMAGKQPRPVSEDVSRFNPPRDSPPPEYEGQGPPGRQKPIHMQYGAHSSPHISGKSYSGYSLCLVSPTVVIHCPW